MWFMDRSGNLAKFFMIMCFVVKLVYTKVVDNLADVPGFLLLTKEPRFPPAVSYKGLQGDNG